jgi:hypothetical protein
MARFLDETGLAYFWEKIKAFFQSHQQTIPEYTIEKKQTAEEGYISSYVLKKNNTQVGATINIPKDYLVKSGEVKTVTVADVPYEGAAVGDKYLDFVVNTVEGSGNTSHIYIPVSDLIEAYREGNGIQINQSNYISVKINSAHANGLGVGGDGLSLYTVTPSSNGVGGTNGAMTATDKEKLDGLTPSELALDSAVVHKTGNENISGTKTFNNDVVLGFNANLILGTEPDEGVYIEASSSQSGAQSLIFASLDDDSAVRLENVATPVNNTDVANKEYVDNSHKGWFYKQNLTQDAQINNSAQCDFEFNTAASTPPSGVYLITGQALINNPNGKENQAHVILRYRLTNNGSYTEISATSVTLAKAMQSTEGGTYGATSVFVQGVVTLDTKPSYLGVEMLVEVETDGNYSYLMTIAPLSGSLVETLTEGATNIVMCRIGDCQNV